MLWRSSATTGQEPVGIILIQAEAKTFLFKWRGSRRRKLTATLLQWDILQHNGGENRWGLWLPSSIWHVFKELQRHEKIKDMYVRIYLSIHSTTCKLHAQHNTSPALQCHQSPVTADCFVSLCVNAASSLRLWSKSNSQRLSVLDVAPLSVEVRMCSGVLTVSSCCRSCVSVLEKYNDSDEFFLISSVQSNELTWDRKLDITRDSGLSLEGCCYCPTPANFLNLCLSVLEQQTELCCYFSAIEQLRLMFNLEVGI